MNKTTSWETSKRLWEKGLRIETEKIHYRLNSGKWVLLASAVELDDWENKRLGVGIYPAPDTVELWGVLPDAFWTIEKLYVQMAIYKQLEKKTCLPVGKEEVCRICYQDIDYPEKNWVCDIENESLPEAFGLAVEWLLDQGYLKGEKKAEL